MGSDGAVRLLAASAGFGELDQPRLVQHPHVKVQVPGVDAEPRSKLAVGEWIVVLAQCLQHLQAQRMAERLELLGAFDGEDV